MMLLDLAVRNLKGFVNAENFLRKRFTLISFLIYIFITHGALADEIQLKSGKQYLDVKTVPFGENHRILFSDGSQVIVPNSDIKSLRPAQVNWKAVPVNIQKNEESKPELNTAPPTQDISRSDNFRWTPILKSAIIPGWGQFSQGGRWKGLLFASSSLVSLEQYWRYRQAHAEAEKQYNDPLPVGLMAAQSWNGSISMTEAVLANYYYLSRREKRVYYYQQQGNQMLGTLFIFWGWNMFDITGNFNGMDTDENHIQSRVGLSINKESVTLYVGFRL